MALVLSLKSKWIVTDNDKYIGIPLCPGSYFGTSNVNIRVEWGDGEETIIHVLDGSAEPQVIFHRYAESGEKTINIFGGYGTTDTDRRIAFNSGELARETKNSLKTIVSWDHFFIHGQGDFKGCSSLGGMPSSGAKFILSADPSTAIVSNSSGTFLCVSTFEGCTSLNSNIEGWENDLLNCTSMNSMFKNANIGKPWIGKWRPDNVTDMTSMFEGSNFNHASIGKWGEKDQPTRVGNVVSMANMFKDCPFDQYIVWWFRDSVHSIKNMSGMFSGTSEFGKGASKGADKIFHWKMYGVEDVSDMFRDNQFFDGWLAGWFHRDQSKNKSPNGSLAVKNMSGMFANSVFGQGAAKNSAAISKWKMDTVEDMSEMFKDNQHFDYYLADWFHPSNAPTVGYVIKNMSGMFAGTSKYGSGYGKNGRAITKWDMSTVEDVSDMFRGNQYFDYFLGDWFKKTSGKTYAVKNMSGLFADSVYGKEWSRNGRRIAVWDMSSVENISEMFKDNQQFDYNLGDWFKRDGTTYNVKDMSGLFESSKFGQANATTGERKTSSTAQWQMKSVETVARMFKDNVAFNGYLNDMFHWNNGPYVVTDMSGMFENSKYWRPLNQWGGGGMKTVENVSRMFAGSSDFNQDIKPWFNNVSKAWNLKNMSGMFEGNTKFNKGIDVWWVGNVEDMSSMFKNNTGYNNSLNDLLKTTPSGGFKVTNMESMFEGNSLYNLSLGDWKMESVVTTKNMFKNSIFDKWIVNWFKQSAGNDRSFSITDISGMFSGAQSLFGSSADNTAINNWDTGTVEQMKDMFKDNPVFGFWTKGWDTSNVVSFSNFKNKADWTAGVLDSFTGPNQSPTSDSKLTGNIDITTTLSVSGFVSLSGTGLFDTLTIDNANVNTPGYVTADQPHILNETAQIGTVVLDVISTDYIGWTYTQDPGIDLTTDLIFTIKYNNCNNAEQAVDIDIIIDGVVAPSTAPVITSIVINEDLSIAQGTNENVNISTTVVSNAAELLAAGDGIASTVHEEYLWYINDVAQPSLGIITGIVNQTGGTFQDGDVVKVSYTLTAREWQNGSLVDTGTATLMSVNASAMSLFTPVVASVTDATITSNPAPNAEGKFIENNSIEFTCTSTNNLSEMVTGPPAYPNAVITYDWMIDGNNVVAGDPGYGNITQPTPDKLIVDGLEASGGYETTYTINCNVTMRSTPAGVQLASDSADNFDATIEVPEPAINLIFNNLTVDGGSSGMGNTYQTPWSQGDATNDEEHHFVLDFTSNASVGGADPGKPVNADSENIVWETSDDNSSWITATGSGAESSDTELYYNAGAYVGQRWLRVTYTITNGTDVVTVTDKIEIGFFKVVVAANHYAKIAAGAMGQELQFGNHVGGETNDWDYAGPYNSNGDNHSGRTTITINTSEVDSNGGTLAFTKQPSAVPPVEYTTGITTDGDIITIIIDGNTPSLFIYDKTGTTSNTMYFYHNDPTGIIDITITTDNVTGELIIDDGTISLPITITGVSDDYYITGVTVTIPYNNAGTGSNVLPQDYTSSSDTDWLVRTGEFTPHVADVGTLYLDAQVQVEQHGSVGDIYVISASLTFTVSEGSGDHQFSNLNISHDAGADHDFIKIVPADFASGADLETYLGANSPKIGNTGSYNEFIPYGTWEKQSGDLTDILVYDQNWNSVYIDIPGGTWYKKDAPNLYGGTGYAAMYQHPMIAGFSEYNPVWRMVYCVDDPNQGNPRTNIVDQDNSNIMWGVQLGDQPYAGHCPAELTAASAGQGAYIAPTSDGGNSYHFLTYDPTGNSSGIAAVIEHGQYTGCTDAGSTNYDFLADYDDGNCAAVVTGCGDPLADNYNLNANTDDGTCTFANTLAQLPTEFLASTLSFDQGWGTPEQHNQILLGYNLATTPQYKYISNPTAGAMRNFKVPEEFDQNGNSIASEYIVSTDIYYYANYANQYNQGAYVYVILFYDYAGERWIWTTSEVSDWDANIGSNGNNDTGQLSGTTGGVIGTYILI